MTASGVCGVVPARGRELHGAGHYGFCNMDARWRGHDSERVGVAP
jgi:hypothetical protein